MEENFDLIAQTRANYYTPGSPVQFVRVELLKGSVSGEHAVCLTFRNISRVTLTALEIHFKCKGVDGVILCEDEFEYRDIEVKPGESFGMDDAVFVTTKAITSVDVSLKNVYNGKRVVRLDAIKRVRLPAPKRLAPEVQAALETRMGRKDMKYMPQMLENGGWYCACGTFHPKEEDTVYCSDCGSDRILLQNALNSLLQPQSNQAAQQDAEQSPKAEATRVMNKPIHTAQAAAGAEVGATRVVSQSKPAEAQNAEPEVKQAARVVSKAEQNEQKHDEVRHRSNPAPAKVREPEPQANDNYYEEYEDEEYEGETMSETLIRWVPPITAIVCAAIALGGFVYYQFFM